MEFRASLIKILFKRTLTWTEVDAGVAYIVFETFLIK